MQEYKQWAPGTEDRSLKHQANSSRNVERYIARINPAAEPGLSQRARSLVV